MYAQILNIEDKVKQNPLEFVSLNDFRFSKGDAISAQTVIEDPNITLYCLDNEDHRAIFVETTADVNLSEVPFYYQAQYENAVRLFAVPYETLYQLSSNLVLQDEPLILIYSVGRCGSTLVSSAFSQVDSVVSLSEPDVYSQLVLMRNVDGSTEADISRLLQVCTKVVCKPSTRQHVPLAWSLKFRGDGIQVADLFYEHFPRAKVLFLYRNAETWFESNARAFGWFNPVAEEYLPEIRAAWKPLAPFLSSKTIENLSVVGWGTLMWLRMMDSYMKLARRGIPALAVRFEDLTTVPEQVIKAICEHCGLTVTDFAKINEVLNRDSQDSTVLSRAKTRQRQIELKEEHLADMQRVLHEHPTIQTADFIVPNTLQL
jgi:hypothetical protein